LSSSAHGPSPSAPRGFRRAASTSILPPPENNDSNMTLLRRKQREENAALWELLRQSKARLEKKKQQEDNNSEDDDNSSDDEEEVDDDDDTEKDGIVEENFEHEYRELFNLLQQSKKRLDDAVRKEEEKAANDKGKATNPYMDLHILPEINEDEEIKDADLTTKELLTAMAVAEEAARSGKDSFETPTKEILRSRDYNSFEFLMEEEEEKKEVLSDDVHQTEESLLIREEKNNCRAIFNVLSKQWVEFEKKATFSIFSFVRGTSEIFFKGFNNRPDLLSIKEENKEENTNN